MVSVFSFTSWVQAAESKAKESEAKGSEAKGSEAKGSKAKEAASEKININTANAEELQKLPGVGPALADAIIKHREGQPFEKIEDIQNVKGIGEKKYEKIKDMITVK
jgi:competence protein ComEA